MKYWSEYVEAARERLVDATVSEGDLDQVADEIARDLTAFLGANRDVATISFLSANPEALGWQAPEAYYVDAGEYLREAATAQLRNEMRRQVLDMSFARVGDIVSTIRAGVSFLAELHGEHPDLIEDFDYIEFAWYQQLEDGLVSLGTAEGVSDTAEILRDLADASDSALRRAGLVRRSLMANHVEPFERVAVLAERHPERFVEEVLAAIPTATHFAA